jgi:uncharacterized protein YrrD
MPKPDKILAQELLEREVLDLTAGETVGSVVDYCLSRDGTVALIGILPARWFTGGVGVPPAAIASLNLERICLAEGTALAPFVPDGQETFSAYADDQIHGKLVLQEDGELLGELVDFAFSLTDGRILDLVVQDASEKRVRVPVEAFKTIGREYIIIQRGALAVQAASAPQPAPAPLPSPAVPSAPVSESAMAEEGLEPEEEPAPAAEFPASGTAALPGARQAESAAAQASTAGGLAEPSREEEKAALFGGAPEPAALSKFDQKKRDFLRGRKAHRDVSSPEGELIVAKGGALDDAALERIIQAGLLGDVFIEMTLAK